MGVSDGIRGDVQAQGGSGMRGVLRLKDVPLTTTQQMISSGSGALLVSLFTTPFDVVKVRLQAQLKTKNKIPKGTHYPRSNT